MSAKPTLLIDGDMLLYSAAQASEFSTDWDEQNFFLTGNLEEAKALVTERLDQYQNRFTSGKTIIALSDPVDNFRKEVDPTYKLARQKNRKPIVYWPLAAWLKDTYMTITRPRLEADDVMGILATSPKTVLPIIISDDKDLLTIPGKLWRGGELHETSPEDADFKWLFQTLTGDATDGYSGCPGVGPVSASKLLKKHGAHFTVVVAAYTKAGLTYEDALRNARLARILRYEDWDAESQSVKLWSPLANDAVAQEPQDAAIQSQGA